MARTRGLPAQITNDAGAIGFAGRARSAVASFGKRTIGVPGTVGTPATIANPIPAKLPAFDSTPSDDGYGQLTASIKKMLGLFEEYNQKNPESDTTEQDMWTEVMNRRSEVYAQHSWQVVLERRFDNLYYAEVVTPEGGADHWPEGRKPGRAHVSDNIAAPYVDLPASLQSLEPVINYVPKSATPEDRTAALNAERLMFRWRDEIGASLVEFDLCLTKCLYGIAWAKVYWDDKQKIPTFTNIDTPSNLWVGWGDSNYRTIDWTAYCYGMSPEAVKRLYPGTDVELVERAGFIIPWVYGTNDHADPLNQFGYESRRQPIPSNISVEIIDYWYYKDGKVWNCIFAGNHMVKQPTPHPEYERLPYIPIPNGRVMGRPFGKSELYDIEQFLREKDNLISGQANMIYKVGHGQMWQVVGAEAPDVGAPINFAPTPNAVVSAGPGNQIVPIQPWFPEMQLEDYHKRLDRELAGSSGVNDLILGLAPAQVLSSSKAVAALVANYESRLYPKRQILYRAYYEIWRMAAQIWSAKDPKVAKIIDDHFRLSIKAPELTPRDTLETASMAIQLVQNKLWSMERGMDANGVDNTNDEKSIIREEQTDASLNPSAVSAMALLMREFQQMGEPPPGSIQQEAGAAQQSLTQGQVANQTRTAMGGGVAGSPSNNAPENSAPAPPEGQPDNAQPGQENAPNGLNPYGSYVQSMERLKNGQVTGEIRAQQRTGG